MSGQGVRWTAEQVLALAPDASSRKSGSRLAAPGPWSGTGAGDDAVWGLCKGSGKTAYRTVVDLAGGDGPGYRCSCPSRKFPCKHALGLLLLWAGEEPSVREQAPKPDWAEEWLTGRRARAAQAGDGGRAAGGGSAAESGGRAAADPEAARRRAERRAAAIAAGATELEQRLEDLLRGGLAGADAPGGGQGGHGGWEETAARMVDAQAPGLAARTRELGTVASSGPGWPERLLSECALLHLLAKGYLHIDTLPDALAATVRTRVGLTVESAAVLAEADADARARDDWLVLAQRDTEEGKLTARRTWLYGRASGRLALLLSFGAAGRAPQAALPVGATLEAELAFYPGARPLRAVLAGQQGAPAAGFVPGDGVGAAGALAEYGDALGADPWLDGWPVVLAEVVPVPPPGPGTGGWQVADASGDAALPVAPGVPDARMWRLTAVSGGEPVTVFGECGHRGFVPHTVWAGADGSAVPL